MSSGTGVERREVALAGALLVAAEAELHGHHPVSMLAATALAVVALRTRRPVAVVLVLPLVLLLDALGGGVLAADSATPLVAVACAAFTAGGRVPPLRLTATAASAVVVLVVADQLTSSRSFALANDVFFYAVVVLTPAAVGAVLGARAAQVDRLRRTTDELARRRDAAARVAALDESARLERAVDAALAERLRAIAAGTARAERLAATRPDEVPAALEQVEDVARAALHELRDVLGLLRCPRPPVLASSPEGDVEAGAVAVAARVRCITWVDVALATAAIPVAVEVAVSGRGPVPLDLLACTAQALALGCLRRAPRRAAAALLAVAAVQTAVLTPLPPTVTWLLPVLLVAFVAAACSDLRGAIAGFGVLLGGGLTVEAVCPAADRDLAGLGPSVALAAAAWLAGRALRGHEQRARRLVVLAAELVQAREAAVRLAVAEQRAGLARELHDVGAHALTVVCLQSGAARRVWRSDPQEARQALRAVVDLGASSLARLQESLAGLADDRGPAPGAPAAEALVWLGRALGLDVEVHVHADLAGLPDDVVLVAHRVVQEALTNTARHASRARVQVRLVRAGGALLVDVEERGPVTTAGGRPLGADLAGSGFGLQGMRERVEAGGGALQLGTSAGGGFAVRARLPLPVALPA